MTLNRGPVRERKHKNLVRTLNPVPSFGREVWCAERRPMETDDKENNAYTNVSAEVVDRSRLNLKKEEEAIDNQSTDNYRAIRALVSSLICVLLLK